MGSAVLLSLSCAQKHLAELKGPKAVSWLLRKIINSKTLQSAFPPPYLSNTAPQFQAVGCLQWYRGEPQPRSCPVFPLSSLRSLSG